MCGKFKQKPDLVALAALLRIPLETAGAMAGAMDISPGKTAAVITGSADKGLLQPMRFGFASAPGMGVRPVINARGETMATKPLFRTAFAAQRCLIPLGGFYEQGRFFALQDGIACMAGLWQTGADGMEECVVVTQPALSPIAPLHDRMPLLLGDTATCRDWLLRAQISVQGTPPDLQEKTPPADHRQMALF